MHLQNNVSDPRKSDLDEFPISLENTEKILICFDGALIPRSKLHSEDEKLDKNEEAHPIKNRLEGVVSNLSDTEKKLADIADEDKGERLGEHYAGSPETCDLCECKFNDRQYFVDGRIKGSYAWGFLCAQCFMENGAGIGWGMGQLFKKKMDGKWLMVGGFHPDEA